jgi:hypothetical protein
MKQSLLLIALLLGCNFDAFAEPGERISAERICVGVNKCVGGAWPMSSVERAYGIKGKPTESEEGVKEICLRRRGIYLRLRYDLRSVAGLNKPAALDVSADAPPEECRAMTVDGPQLTLSPIPLGTSEAGVRKMLGDPDEIWRPQTSDHGLLNGEIGFVYGGSENDFVLIVLRNRVVVRVAASVLP